MTGDARHWFGALIAAAIALGLAYLLAPQEVAEGQEAVLYGNAPLDAHLLQLDKQALEEAYHAHVLKLWAVWLGDGARDSAPITRGLANGRRAYGIAAGQIAKREQQISPGPTSP